MVKNLVEISFNQMVLKVWEWEISDLEGVWIILSPGIIIWHQPKLHALLFSGNPSKITSDICINFDFPLPKWVTFIFRGELLVSGRVSKTCFFGEIETVRATSIVTWISKFVISGPQRSFKGWNVGLKLRLQWHRNLFWALPKHCSSRQWRLIWFPSQK